MNYKKIKYIKNQDILIDSDCFKVGGSFTERYNIWEPQYIDLIYTIINTLNIKNPIFFDIGASTGSFSLLQKCVPDIVTHSFEPIPKIFNILEKNIKLNNIQNIFLNNFALGNNNYETTIKLPSPVEIKKMGNNIEHTGLATLGEKPLRFDDYIEIPTKVITLDYYCEQNNISNIDIIKMDTEGFEYNILQGGKKTISKYQPIIFMEYYVTNMKQCNITEQNILDIINDMNYTILAKYSGDILIAPK
jgi:FkbM family methyltransferase